MVKLLKMSDENLIKFYQRFALENLAKYLEVSPNEIQSPAVDDPNAPHYLEYNGTRYDVKISSPVFISNDKKELIWDFDLREKGVNPNPLPVNFYLLVGIENMTSTKIFLVPIEEAPATHVRISIKGESKYHKYQI